MSGEGAARVAVALLTRDLRVHDNPVLAWACRSAELVAPVFVHDPALRVPPVRARFLAECLADLRGSLRSLGGDLIELRGDPVEQVVGLASAVGATEILIGYDVSGYAARRERRLAEACRSVRIALRVAPGVTVVPPGAVHPAGGDHYRIFTPYWRAWSAVPARPVEPVPARITLPDGAPTAGGPPSADLLAGIAPADRPAGLAPAERPAGRPAGLAPGGERAGRDLLRRWSDRVGGYETSRDELAADATSGLSPYLHFGCLSPGEVVHRLRADPAAEGYLRQLAWRDFFHQVLGAFPELPRRAYRPGAADRWTDDPVALAAWQEGRTGVPLVDAGMRQLAAEGRMHNRARMVTASYLTKHLGQDWRAGLAHFADLLLDADVACNAGNWQWVAGTGNDTRPNRRFNPTRQGERYDPTGDYVRRYLPELAGVPGRAVHQPWRLPAAVRRTLRYPDPMVAP